MSDTLTLERVSESAKDDYRFVTKLVIPKAGIRVLDDLSSCVALAKVDLNTNEISSLAPIGDNSSLAWLNVAHNKLTSLQGVQKLRKLVVLNASHNQITRTIHIAPLKGDSCTRRPFLNTNISHN